jgi:hypothetical protein
MFFTANTPQNHHRAAAALRCRRRTQALPTVYSPAVALPMVAAVVLVPGAFLSFEDYRPANK